jgi:ABC-type sugar transport system substrate-binding protein
MSIPSFVISLTTSENDYQLEQAKSAEQAARRLGVGVRILYSNNDRHSQSEQLLRAIHAKEGRPSGVIFEPVGGTALPQVARAAVEAGVGWAVLNRDVDYIPELRRSGSAPAFALTTDHEEIGHIHGRQLASLLPEGGSALYITGPAESLAAKQRTQGMYDAKPSGVQVRAMKAQWSEASAYRVIGSWLRLSTSQKASIDAIVAQNDAMAAGARKAFQELTEGAARARWESLPYLGCDGLAEAGLDWVRRGLLAATIRVLANAGQALEIMSTALQQGAMPPERILTVPESVPEVELLVSGCGQRARSLSAGV